MDKSQEEEGGSVCGRDSTIMSTVQLVQSLSSVGIGEHAVDHKPRFLK